jgi:hypothetical protein
MQCDGGGITMVAWPQWFNVQMALKSAKLLVNRSYTLTLKTLANQGYHFT